MFEFSVPSYSYLILAVAVMANLATAWMVMLTMGENKGNLFAPGPPLLAGLSIFSLLLYNYNAIVSQELSFWGTVFMAAMGLWGAWVDYTHLSDRRKAGEKTAKPPR